MNRRPSKLQILLVEDKPADASLVQGMLQPGDAYECTVTATLSAALDVASQQFFDIALVDLHLDDSYGPSTVQALVREQPDLPVVVVTGDTSPEVKVTATTAGAVGFISKAGMTAEDLQMEIRVAMARHSRQVFNRTSQDLSTVSQPDIKPLDPTVMAVGLDKSESQKEIVDSIVTALANELRKIPGVVQKEMNPLAGDIAEITATLRVLQSTLDGHSRILTGGSTPEKGLLHRATMTQVGFKECQAACKAREEAENAGRNAINVERTKGKTAILIALITVLGVMVSAFTSAYVAARTVPKSSVMAPTPTPAP